MLKRKRPRPPLNSFDRLFRTTLRHFRTDWSDVLVVVKPETVVGWPRAGLRLYWRWRSGSRAAGQKSATRFEDSSAGWQKRMRAGVLPRSTENFRCSAWRCCNGQWLAICGVFDAVVTPVSHG